MADEILAVEVRLKDFITANLKQVNANIKTFGKTSQQSFNKADKSAAKLALTFGKQLIPALAGLEVARRSIRLFGELVAGTISLEKEMSRVSTLVDTTAVNMEKMTQDVLDLARATGVGPTSLAQGLFQVLSASVAVEDAIKVLDIATRGAVAGFTDTETVVDGLTSVLNAYSFSVDEANRISDIFFQTNKRGKLTINELSNAIARPISVAAELGVRFEEVAAAIATLTRVGFDANTAALSLRSALTGILKPSEDLTRLIKRQGFETGRAFIEAKGFAGVLKVLKTATESGAFQMEKLIPDVRALSAVMTLAGTNAKGFAADLEAMNNVAGDTEEAFKKATDTLSFQLQKFGTNVQVMVDNILIKALPSINSLVEIFNDLFFATKESLQIKRLQETIGLLEGQIKALEAPAETWLQKLRFFGQDKGAQIALLQESIKGVRKELQELLKVEVPEKIVKPPKVIPPTAAPKIAGKDLTTQEQLNIDFLILEKQLQEELRIINNRIVKDEIAAFDDVAEAHRNAQDEIDRVNQEIISSQRALQIATEALAAGLGVTIGATLAKALKGEEIDFQKSVLSFIGGALQIALPALIPGLGGILAGGAAGGLFGGLRHGTQFAQGGRTLVGERGPELVNIPRGSQVTPSERTGNVVNNNNNTSNPTVIVVNSSDVDFVQQIEAVVRDRSLNVPRLLQMGGVSV